MSVRGHRAGENARMTLVEDMFKLLPPAWLQTRNLLRWRKSGSRGTRRAPSLLTPRARVRRHRRQSLEGVGSGSDRLLRGTDEGSSELGSGIAALFRALAIGQNSRGMRKAARPRSRVIRI